MPTPARRVGPPASTCRFRIETADQRPCSADRWTLSRGLVGRDAGGMGALSIRRASSAGSGMQLQLTGQHRFRRTIGITEAVVGATGLAGGVLLALRPDGALLGMDTALIARTAFDDWRIPGILLATFVGGGWITAAIAELRRWRVATTLSITAGFGLVAFEVVEFGLIGWYWLEGVMAAAGLTVSLLAASRFDAPGRHRVSRHHRLETSPGGSGGI